MSTEKPILFSGRALMERSAVISDCGRFRYHLGRQWDASKPRVLFVMLNPSTADAEKDDPTIRKCIGFAQRWGYGALQVVNLFAFRATNPADLNRELKRGSSNSIIGPDNDTHIRLAAGMCERIIAAWGRHGQILRRDLEVMRLLRDRKINALRLSDNGDPWHPLYLPYESPLLEISA